MAYTGRYVRFIDGDERPEVEISVGTLRELLATLDSSLTLHVNPITRDLVLSDGRAINLADEVVWTARRSIWLMKWGSTGD